MPLKLKYLSGFTLDYACRVRRHALALAVLMAGAVLGGGTDAVPRAVPPPGTPKTLLARSPVKPGQTWRISGTTADGVKMTRTLVLNHKAPELDITSTWSFQADVGTVTYDLRDGSFLAYDVYTPTGPDTVLCSGFFKGPVATGALNTGSGDDWGGMGGLGRFDPLFVPPRTTPELITLLRAEGFRVGTCTLTLVK